MCSKNRMISSLILLIGCLGNQNILAATIYQWTDETGNINFSDVPPAESVVIETHEISINLSATSNVDPDKYSIINQVEQMAEWRRQLTEERLAKKKLYLEEKRLAYEMELEKRQQNEAIATTQYIPTTHYYRPYHFLNHRQHGVNAFTHSAKQPVNAPWRKKIAPRKHDRATRQIVFF